MSIGIQSIAQNCIEPLSFSPNNSHENVPQHWCTYNPDLYHDNLFTAYNIRLPSSLAKASEKRKVEYFAGRYCAQQVLTHYYDEDNYTLHSGQNRNPIWPRGLVGSISHSHGVACCTIQKDQNVIGIGIDIEREINKDIIQDINKLVVSSEELNSFNSLSISTEKAFTLAFSAKESFFKAAFPVVNSYFDFDVISVSNIDTKMKTIDLILNKSLCSELKKGRIFRANYFPISEHQIATFIQITR